MPNTTSAKKRLRQNEKRRVRNRVVKQSLKTQLRKVREAVTAGDLDKATQEFKIVTKKLDQAAAKKVIHPNRASRTKSRLQHLLKKSRPAS